MSPRVGIVSVGQTKYEDIENKRSQTYYDMVFEATKKALDDAGLERGDIDTTVEAASGYLKDESRVAEDGTFALAYAYMRIASGIFDTAVVSTHFLETL